MRLKLDMEGVAKRLDASYRIFAEFLAEMKLENLEADLQGEPMKQFLARTYIPDVLQ